MVSSRVELEERNYGCDAPLQISLFENDRPSAIAVFRAAVKVWHALKW